MIELMKKPVSLSFHNSNFPIFSKAFWRDLKIKAHSLYMTMNRIDKSFRNSL